MEEVCINCCGKFPHKNKGYLRTSLESKLPHSQATGIEVLSHEYNILATPGKQRLLCLSCAGFLSKLHCTKTKYSDTNKAFLAKKRHDSYLCQKFVSKSQSSRAKRKTSHLTSPTKSPAKRRRILVKPQKASQSYTKVSNLLFENNCWIKS